MFSSKTEITWTIKTQNALSQEDWSFIKQYDPIIYWSDTDCKYWAFDTKLPSGRWLENMQFQLVGGKKITALVF